MPAPLPILPSELLLPARTLFGPGLLSRLPELGRRYGTRGLLVHGRSFAASGALPPLLDRAAAAGIRLEADEHPGGEPVLADVERVLARARAGSAQWVAAVGGGSVLDIGKAAAALVLAARPVTAYHDGAPLERDGLPFIAVPTTAGTGSEATPNAVLTNPATGVKKSIRDERLMPRLVLLDPDVIRTCSPPVLAHSGMDALTQAIEAFVSRGSTWASDAAALRAVAMVAQALPAMCESPATGPAADLLAGSYLSGIALCQARLGIIHGLAHPLGALYHQPHGLVCAVCLAPCLEFNRPAIGAKYTALSDALGGDALEVVSALGRRLGLSSPFGGAPLAHAESIIDQTLASGSTKANPRPVSRADVARILDALFRPARP